MGSFRTDRITIRVLPEVAIIFEKPRSIIVVPTVPPRLTPVRFSIPILRKGDYVRYWRRFRHKLWRQKRLTYAHCRELAVRTNGVIEMSALSRVKLEPSDKPVEIKYDGWSITGEGGKLTL